MFFAVSNAQLPLLPPIHAFYLLGAAPHDFAEGDLYVNALTPVSCLCCTCYFLKEVINCKVLSMFCGATTDDNYNPNFRFCEPQSGPQPGPESLSSILFVDRIFNSQVIMFVLLQSISWLH